jgi:hypothetical protein
MAGVLRTVLGVSAVLGAAGLAMASGVPAAAGPEPDHSALMEALDAVASRADDPAAMRGTLIWRLRASPMCYADNLTQAELERLIAETGLLPPGLNAGGPTNRFYADTFVWLGDIGVGPSQRAQSAHLTYSFPPDGAMWGISSSTALPMGPNNLNARLVTTFTDLDRGREYLRAAIASWRHYAGVTYTEVGDDGALMTSSSTRDSRRGDIRLGGFPFSPNDLPNGTLAYNAFPSSLGSAPISGGDMAINTSYFIPSTFQLNVSDYRYLRNTVAHEHGHGLGCIHSVPCDATKLMEPTITRTFNMLQRDEIRAAQRNYGDRYSGNTSAGAAHNFGNLTAPVLRSVLARDLSTNGRVGYNFSNQDYFRFHLDSPQTVNISVTPTGEVSTQAQQDVACEPQGGVLTPVDSLNAGSLRLELHNSADALLLAAPVQPPGAVSTLAMPGLSAGDYLVYVYDNGPNPAANMVVQTYDLLIRVGAARATPDPIAGLDKRVLAGTNCWFNGSANSRANETGATIPVAGYDWDLDGDGVVDTEDNAFPSTVYPSNGVYPVTLVLTDSNGMTATDTIQVTAYGAQTIISSVAPANGLPGSTTPVTISGANFKGVTSAAQVTVSGGGVTVFGTPTVNRLGTQITGLAFVVAAGATPTARNVTITNSDGLGTSGTGAGAFMVGAPGGPPPNDECTGAISWGSATGPQAFSNTGATRSSSQSFPSTGCPAAGPIENDVWFSWVAPASGTLTVSTDSASFGFQTRVALWRSSAGCPPTGNAARCDDFGASFNIAATAGQTYRFQVGSVTAGITGTAHVNLALAASQGSCCLPSGACSVTADTGCPGGEWFFAGACNPNFCTQPTGACCAGAACSIANQADCTALPGEFRGVNTVCGDAANPIACCPANFNQVGGVSLQDLFDFLTAWFANDPAADFNHVGGISLQDLFDYLTAWFSGC